LPRRLSGTEQTDTIKIIKGIPTRIHCQKNQGAVKTKQNPVTVGDRIIHRILSTERTPLQNGINQ
jgi:hypothetical protein